MIAATDISIYVLICASLIVLMLDAIGNQQSKSGPLEKPHIALVALISIFGSLFFLSIDLLSDLSIKDSINFNAKLATIFLNVNTAIAVFLVNKTSTKQTDGTVYFLILSSLAVSIYNIASDSIVFKLVMSSGWMVLITTLMIVCTQGGKKAEIGLKLSFSTAILIIQMIIAITFIIYHGASTNITEITFINTTPLTQKMIILFLILSGLSLSGIPPFHSGFIDSIDGGNIGIAFLVLANASIQGCSLLLSSQYLINNSSLLISNNDFGFILIIGFILLWIRSIDQSKIRRTIAYIAASISPLFSMSLIFGESVSLPKVVFLLAIYSFLTLSLSALFGSLAHMNSINQHWQTWEDFSGFGRVNPWHTLIFLIAIASISGLPGTFGYYIKLSLISPMHSNIVFSGLIFLSIVIGAACVMRIFVFVFCKQSSGISATTKPSLFLTFASFILIVLGFFPFVK